MKVGLPIPSLDYQSTRAPYEWFFNNQAGLAAIESDYQAAPTALIYVMLQENCKGA